MMCSSRIEPCWQGDNYALLPPFSSDQPYGKSEVVWKKHSRQKAFVIRYLRSSSAKLSISLHQFQEGLSTIGFRLTLINFAICGARLQIFRLSVAGGNRAYGCKNFREKDAALTSTGEFAMKIKKIDKCLNLSI